jgi:hypothetical protein
MAGDAAPLLMGAIEATFSTDFALLGVYQEGAGGEAETAVFATSAPGAIALVCGTKYARPTLRLERWSGPPPPADGDWEDSDELPFRERQDKGALVIGGFDGPLPGAPRLDVSGLGWARAQVLARGRHVASYGDDLVDQHEAWLVRLWPDPGHRDALWGGPRTIQGVDEQSFPLTSGWAFVSATEVAYVLRWTAPGELQPSVRQIANRMLMSRLSVRQGLETIARLVKSRDEPDPFPEGLPDDDETPTRFVRPKNLGFAYDANR